MSQVKRYMVNGTEFGVNPHPVGDYVEYEEHVAIVASLQEQVQELAAESNKWKPDFCPVTRRPFFMWIEHESGGMVPTYGGPYDSYTIPTVDCDGEFQCERFDHDEGAWVDRVCLSLRLIDDQINVLDDAAILEIGAKAVNAFGIYHNFSDKLFIQQEAQKYAAKLLAGEV